MELELYIIVNKIPKINIKFIRDMTEEIYNAIINPICKHCKSLGADCIGTTIKDWRYAKNCNKWEFARIKPRHDSLKLNDYIIGSDVTTEEILDTI